MPRAGNGGRGCSSAVDIVRDLLRRGFTSNMIREDLAARGYKKARISQLFRAASQTTQTAASDTTDTATQEQPQQEAEEVRTQESAAASSFDEVRATFAFNDTWPSVKIKTAHLATATSRTINRSASLKEGLKVNMELQPRKKHQRQQTPARTCRPPPKATRPWRSRKRRHHRWRFQLRQFHHHRSAAGSPESKPPRPCIHWHLRQHFSLHSKDCFARNPREHLNHASCAQASKERRAPSQPSDPGKQRKFTRHVVRRTARCACTSSRGCRA